MKKGQAAMEFLMTYGWAILVVLAAIGALAYFGVLSPKNLLPSSCTVGPGFGCSEYKADEGTDILELTLRNNMGEAIKDVTVSFSGDAVDCNAISEDGSGDVAWTDVENCADTDCEISTNPVDATIANGKNMGHFQITCTDDGLSGTASTDFEITYKKSDEDLSHTVSGSATMKVE